MQLLTPAEVAQRCRLSQRVILRAIRAGELRGYKLRGRWRIDERDVEAWLSASLHVPAVPAPIELPAPAVQPATGSLAALRAIEQGARAA